MRDPDRIEPFLIELRDLWKTKCPDWRFGQLLSNVLSTYKGDIFFVEEDRFLEIFKKYFDEN